MRDGRRIGDFDVDRVTDLETEFVEFGTRDIDPPLSSRRFARLVCGSSRMRRSNTGSRIDFLRLTTLPLTQINYLRAERNYQYNMTGIVILPAGRDDAFEDYKRFVRDGHPIDDIESYLDEDDLELFRTTSDEDLVHVWGPR